MIAEQVAALGVGQVILDCSGSMAYRRDFGQLVSDLLELRLPVYGFSFEFWRIVKPDDAQRRPEGSNPDIALAHCQEHGFPVALITDGILWGSGNKPVEFPENVTVIEVGMDKV